MKWARRRVIKKQMYTPGEVRKHIEKIRQGKGKHRNAEFEVHYNPARVRYGRYDLVLIESMPIPEGSICANCSDTFEPCEDYLCPQCRRAADS